MNGFKQLIWESGPYPNVMLDSARDLTNIHVAYPYWRLENMFMSKTRLNNVLWDWTNLIRSRKFDRMDISGRITLRGEFFFRKFTPSNPSVGTLNQCIDQIAPHSLSLDRTHPTMTLNSEGQDLTLTVKPFQQLFPLPQTHRRSPQTQKPLPVMMETALYRALVEFHWNFQRKFGHPKLCWEILSHKCIGCHRIMQIQLHYDFPD